MSTDRDDDRWGSDRDSRDDAPLDPEDFRRAKQRVSLPAKMLIAGAVFMLFWAVVNIAVAVSGYDAQVKMLEFFEQQQPPGKARDDMTKQLEEARNRDRTPENIQTAIFSTLGITLDILILVGGLRMHSLSGRTLAMVGAICAIIPANSCCCIGAPIGIWALIVLFDPNVKAAFASAKRNGSPPDLNDDLR